MFGRLGTTELLIILGIILVIFGPSKLPEIGKSLGRGIREFKSATKDIKESINIEEDNEEKSQPKKPEPVKASSSEQGDSKEESASESEQVSSEQATTSEQTTS